jgi:hypothetical protein
VQAANKVLTLSLPVTSAPFSIKYFAASHFLLKQAANRGVRPLLSRSSSRRGCASSSASISAVDKEPACKLGNPLEAGAVAEVAADLTAEVTEVDFTAAPLSALGDADCWYDWSLSARDVGATGTAGTLSSAPAGFTAGTFALGETEDDGAF